MTTNTLITQVNLNTNLKIEEPPSAVLTPGEPTTQTMNKIPPENDDSQPMGTGHYITADLMSGESRKMMDPMSDDYGDHQDGGQEGQSPEETLEGIVNVQEKFRVKKALVRDQNMKRKRINNLML